MAVLWLNASTTQWNDSNVWDTIEDNEIVHRAPTVGDFCYLNGYSITQKNTFVRGITVSNKENPNTGRSGGYITYSGQNDSMNVNANLENGNSYIVYSNSNAVFTITINGYVKGGTVQAIYRTGSNSPRGSVNIYGDVENNGAIIANAISSNYSIYIAGDVSVNGYQLTSQALSSITINGNVTCNQPLASAAVTNMTINGNVTCNNYLTSSTVTNLNLNGRIISNHQMFTATITTMSISGELIFDNGTFLTNCTNVNFNGNVKYRGREPFQLFSITNAVNIQNPDTITFTELEGNETITHIISNWQLNNTNQYPSPANVKKDIPYAWGYMKGMMLPDYPQPANVLKDIEYGRHCAGRNDIVTYDNDRYVYVKTDGVYHWEIEHITSTDVTAVVDTAQLSTAYKGVTTTDIVTNPTANPVIINGTSTNISTDQYVRYGNSVYKWNGSEWILYQTDPKNVPTISIDGASVTADDGYVVKYSGNDKYYMWNSTDIEWQEQTMNYLGETTTDIVNRPSENYITLPYSISENSYIGTLAIPNISDNLIQRLGQSVTVPILQQILDAHLN